MTLAEKIMNYGFINAVAIWVLALLLIALPLGAVAVRIGTPKVRAIHILQTITALASLLISVPFFITFDRAYDGWKHGHEAWGMWGSLAMPAVGIQFGILVVSFILSIAAKHKTRTANQGAHDSLASSAS